jgi:hypothetical protein
MMNSVQFLCQEVSCTNFLPVCVISCAPSVGSPSVKGMCDVSLYHCSKMSGRGTNRALVYLVPQAEVVSILVDSWVRTGVPACGLSCTAW